MVYNPRMSLAPSSQGSHQQHQQQNRNQRRTRDDDVNSFMRLPDDEIVGCITDIGISFTTQDLHKPNPVQIQQIYEWFAELLLNATRATVEPAMRAAAEDVGGDFADSCFPHETRNLMGFYMSLRKLLEEVGVSDFCFADLYRPTYERLNKIFSYVINFVRFRESQAAVIDRHFDRGQTIKNRVGELHQLNHEAEERLAHMKRTRRAVEAQVRDKTARNEELKRQLLELRRNQERVAARLEDAKTKKTELTAALEARAAERLGLRQEIGKLRPYTLQSPQALQQALADLTAALAADRVQTDALDRRARGLQTSADSFGVAAGDVAGCIRLLDEVAGELAKEDDENAKNARQRDALSERGNNAREVERAETLLQRQLQKWNERTQRLRDTSAAKAAEAKDKTAELRRMHKQLTDERTETNREIERRRVRIEQTEKKMLDLKETIENEVHGTYDEYLKMEAHIRLYMTEMEQTLPSSA